MSLCNRFRYVFFTMLFILHPFPSCSVHAEVAITDDTGCQISLEHPAKRIVSLYGGITEIVCAIGACNNLVGVTKRDSWPSQVKTRAKIGTHMRPNLEMIVGLKPDLVIQGSTRPGSQMVVQKLKDMKIPVAIFNPTTFDGIFSAIRRIAALCGHDLEGQKLIEHIKARLNRCRAKYPLSSKPKVIFEVSYPSLLFAAKQNIVNDIITQAGGENSVKKNKKFVRYSLEQIILDNPDVYIIQKGPMNKISLDVQKRTNFQAVRAVRRGRVLMVDEFLFSRPGPRSVQAVELLRKYLYKIAGRPPLDEKLDKCEVQSE